jgi:hypothetical protein
MDIKLYNQCDSNMEKYNVLKRLEGNITMLIMANIRE